MSSIDIAIDLPEDYPPATPCDRNEARVGSSAMRKATWRLIPLIALGYGVAYMDLVNIGFAALHMNANLHFSNTIFGIGAGIFFLSCLTLSANFGVLAAFKQQNRSLITGS